MAEYQNIFTQVQDPGTAYPGVAAADRRPGAAEGKGFIHLLGRFGDAQIGPIYLGTLGLLSLICGFIAFEIIGLNMFASVHWNPDPVRAPVAVAGAGAAAHRPTGCTSRACRMAAGG